MLYGLDITRSRWPRNRKRVFLAVFHGTSFPIKVREQQFSKKRDYPVSSPLLWGRDHIHSPESAGQPMVWRRVSFKCSLSLKASFLCLLLFWRRYDLPRHHSFLVDQDLTSANFHFQAHTWLCWAVAISLSEREWEIDRFSFKLAPRTKAKKASTALTTPEERAARYEILLFTINNS